MSPRPGLEPTALCAEQAKSLANTARCLRKAERELGPVRYCFQDPSKEGLSAIFAWKRQKFRETGGYDVLAAAWIRDLFDVLWRWPAPGFGLVFSTLYFGDRLAAGEVYLRAGDQMHAWIAAYDRDLAVYAPGHILTDKMLDAAPTHGVRVVDFGAGNDDYKARWCLSRRPIREAVVYGASISGRMREAMGAQWRSAAAKLGPVNTVLSRARGLTDHIFSTHGNWAAGAVAFAAAAWDRRRVSA